MQNKYDIDNSSLSPILHSLFMHLNAAHIQYAVLRNYEQLPHSLGNSDLDMLVSEENYADAYKIVNLIAQLYGGKCISCIDDYKTTVINLRLCGKDKNSLLWWGLPIDLFASVGIRQYKHYDATSILNNCKIYRGVRIASAGDAAITSFLKECLANGKSRRNYEKEASLAYASDKQRHIKSLQQYFGKSVTCLWGHYLTIGGNAKTLKNISRLARGALLIKALFRNPLYYFRITFETIRKRTIRLFKPPGFAVAVMGTDGSGKSTIIQEIEPIMEAALHKKPIYEHLRPNWLPSIASLFGRRRPAGPVTDPHASKPSGLIGSFLRLVYYSLDYIFGYWFKIYPALIRRQILYVFDRYYYDYLIDPRRSRICLPRFIIIFVKYLIPSPDLIICLGADPIVIHNRKPEISLAEVYRQVKELKTFCKNNRRAVWIDTGCSIEQSVDAALQAITSRMSNRYANRQKC